MKLALAVLGGAAVGVGGCLMYFVWKFHDFMG